MYRTASDLGRAFSTWTVEIVGHVVGGSQSSVPDARTACGRRKRRSCRKALVQFNELVVLMMIEKPNDKGKVLKCIGIMLDLVDSSDWVVAGTIVRVVRARVVCRMPEEQRGDARDAKSSRGVPWQQTSAEIAEGELVNTAYVASVRLTGTVVEPREDEARWFFIKREVKLVECPCGSVG